MESMTCELFITRYKDFYFFSQNSTLRQTERRKNKVSDPPRRGPCKTWGRTILMPQCAAPKMTSPQSAVR